MHRGSGEAPPVFRPLFADWPERVGRVPQSETTGRMSHKFMASERVATN